MLCLDRRPGESFIIRRNGEIIARVKVERKGHGKLFLGVVAERDVEVVRGELLDGAELEPAA